MSMTWRAISTRPYSHPSQDGFQFKQRRLKVHVDDVVSIICGALSAGPGGAAAQRKATASLSADAVLNLYSNCIKLASENKINAKNTW